MIDFLRFLFIFFLQEVKEAGPHITLLPVILNNNPMILYGMKNSDIFEKRFKMGVNPYMI